MIDTSISTIDRISHTELDRKIDQLTLYLTRVQHRLDAIARIQQPQKSHPTNMVRGITKSHSVEANR
jgi:hypothetical protein